MAKNKIVVSWVSFNNDPYERERDGSYREHNGQKVPGPTLELLFNDYSPVFGQIKKLYLFVRRPISSEQGGRSVHPREEDVAKELITAIKQRSAALEVKPVYWDTNASPTDHKDLFIFTTEKLTHIRRENEKAEIIVNLSPGTPAAQTALLLALQARFAGDKVCAYQGTPIAKRREPSDVVHKVPWNLLAELAAEAPKDNPSAITAEWDIDHARSPRLQDVSKLIKQYGGVPFPVLVIGERGTGKTDIARRLRKRFLEWQCRTPQDWIHLNCAEYQGSDGNTLRSALFGHEQGAYTGADRSHVGLLAKAKEDCVFLDEIHLLDRQAQGLLLLALQREGSFRALGSNVQIKAKFRLIAATNRSRDDLRESLAPDFFDRISDLVIEVPSLRDCREDLGDIWRSVVSRACAEFVERDPTRVLGGVDTLCAEFKSHQTEIEKGIYSMQLPGNIRDLERLARRLLASGLPQEWHYFSLSKDLVRSELSRLKNEDNARVVVNSTESLIDELPTNARCVSFLQETRNAGQIFPVNSAVDEWERRLLSAAKQVCGSDNKAGELLGIQQKTFGNRLNKLGGRMT